jgi:hypothetical protein
LKELQNNFENNPFGGNPRRTRNNGVSYNTNFGNEVYRTPRDATSRRIVDLSMRFANLNKNKLIHTPTDEKHYGNDFVRKFLDQDFADDYDKGKSSVYRTQEDIDKDTINIIKQMEEYNNSDVNKNSEEY